VTLQLKSDHEPQNFKTFISAFFNQKNVFVFFAKGKSSWKMNTHMHFCTRDNCVGFLLFKSLKGYFYFVALFCLYFEFRFSDNKSSNPVFFCN
jgi:hypothetical protein